MIKTNSGEKQLPEFFDHLTKEQMEKILQTMFSADGSICLGVKWNTQESRWKFTRKIKLTCWNENLKEDIKTLLSKTKIGFTIEPTDIVIEKEMDIIKFAREIRFIKMV